MEPNVQKKMIEINRQFYDRFATSFSATRGRVQPGVRRQLPQIMSAKTVIDVGCGNGTLARALSESGFTGEYLGLDMSKALLAAAKQAFEEPKLGQFTFQQSDLVDPDWNTELPSDHFDLLVSFAVLHHLPGEQCRSQIIGAFHDLVSPDGTVVVSVWQWQNSPRLKKRVVPWTEVSLDPDEVDQGDILLDWRASDQVGLRYVHTFSEASLTALAEEAGFRVVESFYSDGKPGNLALYQVWEPIRMR
jgi:tRNA (uracil-5-)-methyltransferase TRM9